MGERKVLNYYIPPDFNPAKIPRRRKPKNRQENVRMMLPMSVRCKTCGNYIYKGTKFNSRKEDVMGETYLGIQILRFYFKCTTCSAEITFETDPQNSDYAVGSGATRNFEPWRKEKSKGGEEEEEGRGDAIKSLENRTSDSKLEMDILATLDELKSMKSRRARVGVDTMFQALHEPSTATREQEKVFEEENDQALVKLIAFQQSRNYVHRRIRDDDLDDVGQPNHVVKMQKVSQSQLSKTSLKFSVVSKPIGTTSNKRKLCGNEVSKNEQDVGSSGLQSLCQNYDSSGED